MTNVNGEPTMTRAVLLRSGGMKVTGRGIAFTRWDAKDRKPTPATFPNYDVSPDGQRFLMLKPVEQAEAAPTRINVVLNWFEELKQKVPTGKK
jgi:hypothetical protein